ncbi:DUF7010 family protein [Synoicihabitans lomoniglobus]|uniref:Uncharacterized protein n=1 Tax=Synoicihabitans lomoniglobus TaxID=2909285 RepID=A0AAE9ZWE9_9BACT|nr:hypothetical protein [Opitutaceae bacterium LMO-M01]WED63758.1 hypothetical protein PXH66_15585 [Opitutaceae bacterium LMO-M01]
MYNPTSALSLEVQWQQFAASRFNTMPIAGTMAWSIIGIASLVLPPHFANLVIFIATGSIFYLALGLAKITGEDLLGKKRPGNFFDRIFLSCVFMACLVYAIAIPFFFIDRSSLPLTVGILTGLMWIPFSIIVRHWVGLFHGITRTALIVVAWYLIPEYRTAAISAIIVGVYAITLVVLRQRHRAFHAAAAQP